MITSKVFSEPNTCSAPDSAMQESNGFGRCAGQASVEHIDGREKDRDPSVEEI